jgi:transposase
MSNEAGASFGVRAMAVFDSLTATEAELDSKQHQVDALSELPRWCGIHARYVLRSALRVIETIRQNDRRAAA